MDAKKIFAKYEKEMESLRQTIRIYNHIEEWNLVLKSVPCS